MSNKLIHDFQDHGFDLISRGPGEMIFRAKKSEYKKRRNEKIHKTHPIWFDDENKNLPGSESMVIVKCRCARCNQPIDDGFCIKCGRKLPMPIAKSHIPWKHQLEGK